MAGYGSYLAGSLEYGYGLANGYGYGTWHLNHTFVAVDER
jgi:hypothetical protein